MNKYSVREILAGELDFIGKEIEISGWVKTIRVSKSFSFIELNDGSIIKNLQIVVNSDVENYDMFISDINTGTSIKVTGNIVKSPGEKQSVELQAKKIEILGLCSAEDYPLQKKKHSLEFLREIQHLRPRTNTIGAVMRVRSAASFAIHNYFQQNGFFYVHSPIITGSDCEGAGQMFQVTTLNLENIPKNEKNQIDYSKDFFNKKVNLTVSGQLEAEIMAMALGKVYTFGPTFRAEHSNTTRHLAEFWMIEPEMAFYDINDNMNLAEDFIKYIIKYVLEKCPDDIEFFNKWIETNLINTLNNILNNNFERITYTEAIKILEDSKQNFQYPVKWGIDMQSEHEKFLTEVYFKKPVIVTNYPKEIKAFYMKLNDDNKTVRAMDILVPGLGEIVGGSQREENYEKLLNRIRELKLDEKDYWWYLDLRRFGTVPHSGFGLGFERLIQLITGMQNIRDVIPFPRSYKYINI